MVVGRFVIWRKKYRTQTSTCIICFILRWHGATALTIFFFFYSYFSCLQNEWFMGWIEVNSSGQWIEQYHGEGSGMDIRGQGLWSQICIHRSVYLYACVTSKAQQRLWCKSNDARGESSMRINFFFVRIAFWQRISTGYVVVHCGAQ